MYFLKFHSLILFFSVLLIFNCLNAADNNEKLYLKSVTVEGNRITKTNYILSHISLKPGNWYTMSSIMKEINKSKASLQQTGLFSSIFFDDQLDNSGNLLLTIKVNEKNYLYFSPWGYIFFDSKPEYDLYIYTGYDNLCGKACHLDIFIPFYENRGISVQFRNGIKTSYKLSGRLDYRTNPSTVSSTSISSAGMYKVFSNLYTGMELKVYRQDFFTFFISPLIEEGTEQRPDISIKTWHFLKNSFILGISEGKKPMYGISTRFYIHHDLFLQIIASLEAGLDYLYGEIPRGLMLTSNVRGINPQSYSDNKRFSLAGNIYIPYPFNEKLGLSLFVDSNIIGNNYKPLIGGGVGFRWFTKYQNPFIFDIAYGKGFMINFSKRF